jgi:hypothetical protein
LDTDTDAHTSQDKLLPHKSDSDQNKMQTVHTQSQHGVPVTCRFTEGLSEIRQNEAPTVNKDMTPPPTKHLNAVFN